MYPWQGGDFNLQELIASTEDFEGEEDVLVSIGVGTGPEANVLAHDETFNLE